MDSHSDDSHNFYRTGPSHLTHDAVDWNNVDHRRSIAASLVEGVYTMQYDRQENLEGPRALAPPWWEFFNFKLFKTLQDDKRSHPYFGAIYEYVYANNNHVVTYSGLRPPRFVIAFRGTIKKCDTKWEDFKLNLHCTINNLHNCSRFRMGLDATRNMVNMAGPGNVWLAGHSLGASLGLLIGRHMITDFGIHVETYLFNPPFPSLPVGRITNQKLKLGLSFGKRILTVALATTFNHGKPSESDERDRFNKLSTWVPYLFVNKWDPICSEFINHFEHREKMEEMGMGQIEMIAAENSVRNMLASKLGKRDCEATYLIPCAYLIINSSPYQSSNPFKKLKEAHRISQWWRSDLELNYKLSRIYTDGVNRIAPDQILFYKFLNLTPYIN